MTFNKKEYNRQRARERYEDFSRRRELLFKRLGSKCYICDKPSAKGFHLHHVKYDEIESDYPRNSKAMSTRIKRLEEAEANPDRFRLLCAQCHFLVTSIQNRHINLTRVLECAH